MMDGARKQIMDSNEFTIFAELRKASMSNVNFKTISKNENDQILEIAKAKKLSTKNKIEMDYFVVKM